MTLGKQDRQAQSLLRAIWLVIGVLLLTRLALIAWIPLMDTTEGRYGEIGRKMVATGDWITPWHEHGVPFLGKPPLSFWITALSFKLLGIHEFAARLPHLLCSVATVACVWNAARAQGAAVAAIASALMAASLLFYMGGAAVMTDPALVLGITVATCSTWLAMASDDAAQRARHRWLAFVGVAIGILAKGPLTLVLIGTPVFLWVLWCGRWTALWQALPWARGLALTAALVLPWFVLAEQKTPGFIEYFIVGEHFHRFVTPGWDGDLYGNAHHRPKGMIWAYAAGALVPWTALVPLLWVWRRRSAGREGGQGTQPVVRSTDSTGMNAAGVAATGSTGPWALTRREQARLAMLWGLVPLLFFTVSSNIIWTYVMPAIPGLAWWGALWMGDRPVQGLRWALAGAVLAAVTMVGGAWVAEHKGRYARGSAKWLVQACEEAGSPAVVVLGRRSFSADYYSAGRAQRVDELGALAATWPATGRCVALATEDRQAVEAAGLHVARDLGRLHARQVLWVVPGARP